MSAIVFSERGGACGICLEKFSAGEKQYTHEGGKHDGFHKKCLKQWLDIEKKCPYDRQNIDPNSLTSRTEKVMRMLKASLENAAYATAIGGVIEGSVAAIAGIGIGRAGIGLGRAAGAVGAAVAGPGVLALGGVALGGLGVGGAVSVAGAIALGAAAVGGGAQAVGAEAGALILAVCIGRILERRGVHLWARVIIGYGICGGGFATEVLAQYAHPVKAIMGGSLTGGCLAGILSMLKPYVER